MNSSFGRRVISPGSNALVLVPESLRGVEADLTGRDEEKERVRARLMEQIDPTIAAKVPRSRLRAEVAIMVSAIATELKVQLNEAEESQLATELTDDMVGLGPLEPLLQDETVT